MKKIVSLICVLALCITGLSMAASAQVVEGYTITTATSKDGAWIDSNKSKIGYDVTSVTCSVSSAQAALTLYLKSYTNPFYGYRCSPTYLIKRGSQYECKWDNLKVGPYLIHMQAQNNVNSGSQKVNVVVYGDFGNIL